MYPGLAESKLLQGLEKKSPFYSIKSFLKIQEEKH